MRLHFCPITDRLDGLASSTVRQFLLFASQIPCDLRQFRHDALQCVPFVRQTRRRPALHRTANQIKSHRLNVVHKVVFIP